MQNHTTPQRSERAQETGLFSILARGAFEAVETTARDYLYRYLDEGIEYIDRYVDEKSKEVARQLLLSLTAFVGITFLLVGTALWINELFPQTDVYGFFIVGIVTLFLAWFLNTHRSGR